MFRKLIEWLKSLFSAPKVGVDKPIEYVVLPTSKLTREGVLKVYRDMCEGKIKTKNGPYVLVRETKGKNRSKQIDAINLDQKSYLGAPYCMNGQQDALDELCKYFGIDRRKVRFKETASCDSAFRWIEKNAKEFLLDRPKPMVYVIYQYSDGTGHIECCLTEADVRGIFETFGFNTNIDGDDAVVRDGQGAGYVKRNIRGYGSAKVRGYFDVYAALEEAKK